MRCRRNIPANKRVSAGELPKYRNKLIGYNKMRKKDKTIVKKVAKDYIGNGLNMSKALKPFNGHLGSNSLSVKASRWKTSEDVKKEIERLINTYNPKDVTPDMIISKLYSVIYDNDKRFSGSNRMQALELLGKYLTLFKDKDIQINTNIISEDTLNRIKSNRIPNTNNTGE